MTMKKNCNEIKTDNTEDMKISTIAVIYALFIVIFPDVTGLFFFLGWCLSYSISLISLKI